MNVSWLDVKLGIRMFIKYPGLSLVSVVGMAVAIAIGAGYFTILGTWLNVPWFAPFVYGAAIKIGLLVAPGLREADG